MPPENFEFLNKRPGRLIEPLWYEDSFFSTRERVIYTVYIIEKNDQSFNNTILERFYLPESLTSFPSKYQSTSGSGSPSHTQSIITVLPTFASCLLGSFSTNTGAPKVNT